MDFKEYQALAARTSSPDRAARDRLINAALGLAGEGGEVIELVKKHLHHGHELPREKLAREIGDVLWYIAELCSATGLELGAVAEGNIDKLRARYPEGFSSERSINRPGEAD